MAGEMGRIDPVTGIEPDGTEWPYVAAIAKRVGGVIKPFDKYQGPYVVIGADLRVGNAPYACPVPGFGIIRLWIVSDEEPGFARVYREDTDQLSGLCFNAEEAADAAEALMRGG